MTSFRSSPHLHNKGFALLEAIVALVIFSSVAMGIYGWINTNLNSLQRVVAVTEANHLLQVGVEYLKIQDLDKQQQGVIPQGNYRIEWRAQLLEPWQKGVTAKGMTGLYDFGLYNIDLLLYKDLRYLGEYSYRYVAHKKVRSLEFE